MVAPFFLVLATPIMLVILSFQIFRDHCWIACLLFPVLFVIGLALDVITIPLMIIAFIVMVCSFLFNSCRSRYENKRRAAARIKEIIERNRKLIEFDGDNRSED